MSFFTINRVATHIAIRHLTVGRYDCLAAWPSLHLYGQIKCVFKNMFMCIYLNEALA